MKETKDLITIDDLRNIPGFDTFNDEELGKIAASIKELALLIDLVRLSKNFKEMVFEKFPTI